VLTVNTTLPKTALFYIHDHLINAVGSQSQIVSRLRLLDLPTAFDTIDHNILLSRLSSWLDIRGIVLKWFTSYLSSHTFRDKCANNLKLLSCLLVYLNDLFLVLYFSTTFLSNLISSLSLKHFLYADDTQIFLSFGPPPSFHYGITILQTILQLISSWMTAIL